MQGGLASLGIVARNLARRLIGSDPLDHAVLLDTLLHEFVKLGPEGALTGALAALDIALWDLKGKLFGQPIYKLLGGAWRTALPFYASIGGNGERTVDEVSARRRGAAQGPARGGQDPLRRRPHQARQRHPRRHRQGARGAAIGRRRFPVGLRRQQRILGRRRDPRRPGARRTRLLVVRGAGAALSRAMRWARSRAGSTSPSRPASRPIHYRALRI